MRPANVRCSNCRIRNWCITSGSTQNELKEIEPIVKQPQPVHKLQRLYSVGDEFNSVYVVRSGCVKTYVTSIAGDQHITNFYYPGDVFGIDGVLDGRYYRTAEALGTTSVCELPFEKLETLSRKIKPLQHQINRTIGREFIDDQQILLQLGKMTSSQKIAAFLTNTANKLHRRGLSETEFYLPMTRTDIANYLGMAVETVSRQITYFQEQGIIRAARNHIVINDTEQLKFVANFSNNLPKPSAVRTNWN